MQSIIYKIAHSIAAQEDFIIHLSDTIAALLEKNKYSKKSSKPPSSDWLNKKNRSIKQSLCKQGGFPVMKME